MAEADFSSSSSELEEAFENLEISYWNGLRRKLKKLIKKKNAKRKNPDYLGLPNYDDKKTFKNTFYGKKWPKGKTVLVLRIIDADEEGDDIWMVVHNKPGSHAEEVLEDYLDKLSKSESDHLKKCDFVIYINWAPCDECADALINVFKYCFEGTVLITALYTSRDKDVSYNNYEGWKKLKEKVTFGYMRRPDYRCLEIMPPTTVKTNNEDHSDYAVGKMPTSERETVRLFCDKLF